MGKVIAYDRDIVDLIDELSATGHVTHKAYRKTSVTFHHNAGTGGHEQVLNTWQTRPASAHFNVDREGSVAQFVRVNEYAWATGNTEGNVRSISIEMTNEDGHPDWPVAEVTIDEACRLAAWLHWKVLGAIPTKSTIKFHSDWKATACPGPSVHDQRDEIVALVKAYYNRFIEFIKPEPDPEPSKPPSRPNRYPQQPEIVKKHQRLLDVTADGKWGPNTDARMTMMRNAAWSHAGYPVNRGMQHDIETVQRVIDTKVDGIWGPNSQAALHDWIRRWQKHAQTDADGWWGVKSDQKWLLARKRHNGNY